MRSSIKDCFVCEFCRNVCKGPCDELLQQIGRGEITEENKDLIGRKHRIKCLGKYCDNPCEYQDLSAYEGVDISPFIEEIKFLLNEVNKLIEEKNK